MASTESLAAQHLAIAIQLMGRDWVLAHLPAEAPAAPVAGSQRGRKAGAVPEPDRRCRWHPEGRDQCKNSRFENNSYCKIHLSQVHLIDQ
jgi:hypothetical protein